MSKVTKNLAITILHTLAGVVLVIILLILTLALALSLPRTQSFVARRAVKWLSSKTDTRIAIDKISIENLTRLTAENLYIEDLQGDTLLWVGKASAAIDRKALLHSGSFVPRNVMAKDVLFDMKTDSLGTLNLDQLIRHIASHFPADTTKTPTPFIIEGAEVENMRYRLYDARLAGHTPDGVIDYSDMDLNISSARFGTIEIDGPAVRLTNITNLNAVDRSGASLEQSTLGSLTVGRALLDFRRINFRSDGTHLQLPYLIIEGEEWEDYSDFCDKVALHLEVRGSTLEARSAGRFVDILGQLGIYGERINGVFDGTVCDFSADIAARLYDSEVAVIGEVKELLHPENITAEVDLEVGTTPDKVGQIYRNILHQPLPEEVEVWTSKFDTLSLDGIIKLSPEVVDADALIETDLGEVEIDGLLRYGPKVAFEGYLHGNSIALGRLTDIEQLGRTDLEAQGYIIVEENKIEGDIAAVVERLGWKEYEFADITIHTSISENNLQASASSADRNLTFAMDGSASVNADKQPEYDLSLNLERANLAALGIVVGKEGGSWLTANLEASLEGSRLDDMNGRAMINDLIYVAQTDTLSTELINISLSSSADTKSFTLYSPIADVEYHSNAPYASVAEFFTRTIPAKLPLATRSEDGAQQQQPSSTPSLGGRFYAADDYSAISINIKEGEALASVVVPNSNLAPDSSLSMEFSPSAGEFALMLDSEYVVVDDVVVSQFHLDAEGTTERLHLGAECEELLAMGLSIPEVSVEASCADSEDVALALYFSNSDSALSGRLNVDANFVRDAEGKVVAHATIGDSYLLSPSERWNIGANQLLYGADGLSIENFHISNSVGGLYLNGEVSNTPASPPLTLELSNIAVGEWLTVTDVAQGVEGTIDGLLRLHSLSSSLPYGEGSIVFSSLSVGGVDIDPMAIDVEIPEGGTRLNVELGNTNLDTTLLVGEIDYRTGDYNSDITIRQIDLSLIDPLLRGIVSRTKGVGSVDMALSGSKGLLSMDGRVSVGDFATWVDFTGAHYKADNVELTFNNNRGVVTPFRIEDSENGWAEAEGYVNFENLNNVDFGISLVPHNLVAIDLEPDPNADFYGKVYASGGLKILSKNNKTEISGAVSTGAGSVFNIPLRGNNDFAGADFVTFVNRSEAREEEESSVVAQKRLELSHPSKSGGGGELAMDVQLGVDTDTQLRLLIDPATDNVIEARGVADLGITLDSRKRDLAIRGDYQIADGVYNFNFQNLITKQFTINSGSFIRWNGSPLDADIDVGATYKLKTSLAPLIGAESGASRASTPVECIVNLTGSLSKVDVSFDINVPTANTEYQSILSSYFSSQEMMATQFVYLLALGNFYSDTTTGPATTAGTAGTAIGLDFLASQVSRLVSNDAYKFNLKYKAIDDTSSSYSIDFQTEIIDDRLLLELEANVDTGDYYQSMGGENNQLSGGGAITLLLDDSGDFYLKGFSRTIDRFDENQGLQENGVGLYYQRSFNRLKDLWRKKKRAEREDSEKSNNFATEQAQLPTIGEAGSADKQDK